jgi:hypothetical protein
MSAVKPLRSSLTVTFILIVNISPTSFPPRAPATRIGGGVFPYLVCVKYILAQQMQEFRVELRNRHRLEHDLSAMPIAAAEPEDVIDEVELWKCSPLTDVSGVPKPRAVTRRVTCQE